MATNEDADDETLGGAAMHSRVSGVSDYLARDERHGTELARQIVAELNSATGSTPTKTQSRPATVRMSFSL